MKSKFFTDLQDTFDGILNTAAAEAYTNLFPAFARDIFQSGGGAVEIFGRPVLTSEAVAASSAQSGPATIVSMTTGGIIINLLFDAAAMAAPASFRAGIQQAASILTGAISDHITVNIKIDYSGTGGGASAGPDNGLYQSYSSVRANLISHATPGDTTFNALSSGSSIQGQSNVAVWNAQLKLWGMIGANDTSTDDGSATFATDINPNLLVGVALHELTHAMGRVPYGPPYSSAPDIFDLFRFTSPGTRLIDGANTAVAAYFSVDGGYTKLADYGRNSDPSDFLNSGVQGPNDPFNEYYTGGTIQGLSAADLKQLDALGFHLTVADTQAPTLARDNPLLITAGATQTITSSLLSATDNVSSPAQLHFTVTTAPSHGTLLLNGSATSSFTQADISNGVVSYHEAANFLTSDSFLFTVTDAAGNTTATNSFQISIEPVCSGNRLDYQMTYNSVGHTLTVLDQRQGSPEGTHILDHVQQVQFSDGSSTYAFDAAGALLSETFTHINGTHWVNAFDTVGNQTWVWSINHYDINGALATQSGLNHDGTHWLTLYDVNNQYSWADVTMHFDANWNETSTTGTRDNGSHSLTMDDIQAAYDTVTWYASPFTNVNSVVASVAPQVALTGTAGGLFTEQEGSFVFAASSGKNVAPNSPLQNIAEISSDQNDLTLSQGSPIFVLAANLASDHGASHFGIADDLPAPHALPAILPTIGHFFF